MYGRPDFNVLMKSMAREIRTRDQCDSVVTDREFRVKCGHLVVGIGFAGEDTRCRHIARPHRAEHRQLALNAVADQGHRYSSMPSRHRQLLQKFTCAFGEDITHENDLYVS